MGQKFEGKCRKCSSTDLYWYDGLLGYEAIKCKKCGEEYNDSNPIIVSGS